MVDGIIWHLASGYLALGSRRGSQGFVQRRAALVHLPPRLSNPMWLENRHIGIGGFNGKNMENVMQIIANIGNMPL